MAKIRLSDYLAYNDAPVQEAVLQVMHNMGYTINPKNDQELADCIQQFLNHEDRRGNYEGAMLMLAEVHPDRDLILKTAPPKRLNADGIGSDLDMSIPKRAQPSPVTIINPENNSNSNPMTSQAVVAGIFCMSIIGLVAILNRH